MLTNHNKPQPQPQSRAERRVFVILQRKVIKSVEQERITCSPTIITIIIIRTVAQAESRRSGAGTGSPTTDENTTKSITDNTLTVALFSLCVCVPAVCVYLCL